MHLNPFSQPTFSSLPIDTPSAGNVFIADTNRHVIRKYTATSHVVTVYAGTDGSPGFTGDGKRASSAKLNSPIGIAIDFLGNVYFADTNNYRIRRVDWGPGNNRTITTIAGNGLCCWSGSSPTLVKSYLTSDIYGLAVTPYGTLYFPSEMKYSVRAMQVPTSGNLGTTCGNCYLPSSAGSLCCQNSSQIVAAHIALQLTYNSSNKTDSPTSQPSTLPSNQPSSEPSTFVIHQLTVVAGNPYTSGNSGNGGAATSATMYSPYDVAVDSSNNLYILDVHYNVVRKVSSTTGIITTVAGNGSTCNYGYSPSDNGGAYFLMTAQYQNSSSCGDGGAATSASFNNAYGIAVDVSGNLFIADRGNLVVRKMTVSTGIISAVAGRGYYTSGVGSCQTCYQTCYQFCCSSCSCGIFNMFYCSNDCGSCGSYQCNSYGCNPYPCGTCSYTTYASGFRGDGGAATSAYLNNPSGVAVDISGNLYVSDTGNNRIRMVASSTQYITTLVYTGTTGATYLSNPWRIAVDQTGDTPSQSISTHPINPHSHHTLLTHPLVTPF